MLRGSKPQPSVVPRGWATPSRYAILPVDHEDTTDDLGVPDVQDLDHPASPVTYVMQTRSQSKIPAMPTLVPEQQATLAKDKTPSGDEAGKPGGEPGGKTAQPGGKTDKPGGSVLATPNGDLLLIHRRQGHAHSHPDCLDCQMGKMQARKTPFSIPTDTRFPVQAGYRMAGDMKGPLRPDINGNMWHLVLVDMDSKQGYVHSLPSKQSGGVKIGVQKFWATLKKTTGSAMDISLFHSDDGKEFMGELDDFLLTMGVTRTNTGGYAAKYNVIVEQRIKTLLGRMRANLSMA